MNLAQVLAQQGYAGNDPFPSNVRQPQPDELATALADLGVGIPANLAGLPVDLASALIRPFGYNVPPEQTVGSTEWFQSRAGRDPNSAASMLSAYVSPDPLDVARFADMAPAIFAGLRSLGPLWSKEVRTSHGVKTGEQLEKDLERAYMMAGEGAPDHLIWEETGWFRGADGGFRFEIDDSEAALTEWTPRHGQANASWPGRKGATVQLPLEDYLQHRDANAVFGPLRSDAPGVFFDDMEGKASGFYDPQNDSIGLSPYLRALPELTGNPDEELSVAMHEIQHALQKREKFAEGGSPDDFPRFTPRQRETRLAEIDGQISALASSYGEGRFIISGFDPEKAGDGLKADPMFRELMDRRASILASMDPQQRYRNMAGEVEARNVQTRLRMTPENRRALPPFETEDVPRNRQTHFK